MQKEQMLRAEASAPEPRSRWWRWLAVVLAVPVLTLGGVLTYELNREYFPRLGLPSFDRAKAAKLSPEKRAAYEQELFSELQLWNRGSRKYPTVEDIEKREQRWQAMADDGFELAHITLRVLKPKGGYVYSLRGPMKRLEELAAQGNVGAMCLMPGLVGNATLKLDTTQYETTYRKWMARGAKMGHPECQQALGGRYLLGVDGYAKDVPRGLQLIFSARRAGYMHDVGDLILHYQDKGYANADDVRRLFCWMQIEEAQVWQSGEPQRVLRELQTEATRTGRKDLLMLGDELRGKQLALQDCIKLGAGD